MSWDTQDELAFISGLTNHQNVGEHHHKIATAEDRLAMLLLYKKGIALRSKWEGLDQKLIEAHLQALINNLQQSLTKEKK
jgi:hypothetical protein